MSLVPTIDILGRDDEGLVIYRASFNQLFRSGGYALPYSASELKSQLEAHLEREVTVVSVGRGSLKYTLVPVEPTFDTITIDTEPSTVQPSTAEISVEQFTLEASLDGEDATVTVSTSAGTLGGTTSVASSGGSVSFSDLEIRGVNPGETFTLTLSADGYADASSSEITVTVPDLTDIATLLFVMGDWDSDNEEVPDAAGGGVPLVVPITGVAPVPTTLGGRSALSFDDTLNQELFFDNLSEGSYPQPVTIVFLGRFDFTSAYRRWWGGSSNDGTIASGTTPSEIYIAGDDGRIVSVDNWDGVTTAWVIVFNGASTKVYQNGGTAKTPASSPGSDAIRKRARIMDLDLGGANAAGTLYAVMLVDSALTPAQINAYIGPHLEWIGGSWTPAV